MISANGGEVPAYKLATVASDQGPHAALVVDGRVYNAGRLAGRSEFQTMLSILSDWARREPELQELARACVGRDGPRIEETQFLAPILYPPAVYCAGANYRDHVANMERKLGLLPSPDPRADGGRPFHFLKASRCCVGPDASVRAPSKRLDWEGELVVVIGREARNIGVGAALSHVAGYMIGNDLSARDVGFRPQNPPPSIFHHSWIDHKSFEGAAPLGPWMVPASQISDPTALQIRTYVNGTLKQEASCAGMIFSIEEQIAYLSTVIALVPGDIVMTGTPAGVGMETGEFLAPGDRVEVQISQIGTLRTFIV